MRRGKDESGSREMKQKAVPCPAQTKEYCEMFHLIDKGNGKEAKYDMAGKSRSQNWAPHDRAGRFDHRRFVLWGPINYEFNEGVTNNSYVGRYTNAPIFGSHHSYVPTQKVRVRVCSFPPEGK